MIAPARDPMLPRPFRVGKIVRETGDTVTFELFPRDGDRAVPFAPGQFNMLYAAGVGEVPISISGDPARTDRLVHTLRAVGTVTRAFLGLKRGDAVGVRGPFGTHWPMEAAVGKDVVIATGGIGLAPLRPAIYEIIARRERYGRVVLLYGARTPLDILYGDELGVWKGKHEIDVQVTVDRATDDWRGRVGVVTMLIPRAGFDPRNTVSMICGPEVMARFAVAGLDRRGVLPHNIYVSMERNMKCGVGLCGHCQFGPGFVCKDGPVFAYDQVAGIFDTAEV